MSLHLVPVLLLLAEAPFSSCTLAPNISRADFQLRQHLFSSISSHTRPKLNQSQPIDVTLGVEINQIISVEERTQQIKFKLWTRMKWTNEFLEWHPEEWENIQSLKVAPTDIWTPDITLYEDIDEQQLAGSDKYNKDVRMYSNGTNVWNAPGIFKSICRMDVQYFPFDVQYCVLKFGSWEYDASELSLVKNPLDPVTEKYIPSSEWDLIHVDVSINTLYYNCCENPFQDMAFKFVIHRRPLYYVFNVIIPCLILMCLCLFSFFLPPDSGERITIVVTVLLAFTVILQMLNQSMPRNSDSSPVLLVFYVIIMAESTFSLFTTCIVLIAHHRGRERWTTPLPDWIKTFMDKLSRPLCVYRSNTRNSFRENKNLPIMNGPAYKSLSKIMSDNKMANNFTKQISETMSGLDYLQHQKLDTILNELEIITTQIKETELQDQHELDWKQFARFLDRLFFYLILLAYVVSSVGILIPAYFRHGVEDEMLKEH